MAKQKSMKSIVKKAGAWVKSWGEQKFIEHGEQLRSLGMSDDDIEKTLKSLYAAVSEQYGN